MPRHFDVHCARCSFRNSAVTSASLTDVYPAFPQSIEAQVTQIMPHPPRLQVSHFIYALLPFITPHTVRQ